MQGISHWQVYDKMTWKAHTWGIAEMARYTPGYGLYDTYQGMVNTLSGIRPNSTCTMEI
jgi:hypothetical protein